MFNLVFDPIVIGDILNDQEMSELKSHLEELNKHSFRDNGFKRNLANSNYLDELCQNKFVPLARQVFRTDNLEMTYSLYSKYDSPESNLIKHRDDNACTYTLDFCVSAKTPWPIWVEDKEYPVKENEALAFLGEDQTHWREAFPDPENNIVEMIFFHFAPKEHWWFTKGRDYVKVISQKRQNLASQLGISPQEVHKVPNYRDYIY